MILAGVHVVGDAVPVIEKFWQHIPRSAIQEQIPGAGGCIAQLDFLIADDQVAQAVVFRADAVVDPVIGVSHRGEPALVDRHVLAQVIIIQLDAPARLDDPRATDPGRRQPENPTGALDLLLNQAADLAFINYPRNA